MGLETFLGYLQTYGAIAIFVIVLLEYMNLPGFPAGIIMPLAGVWASRGGMSFLAALLLSVAAGLLGSWILYFLGRFCGGPILDKWKQKFPKQQPTIDKALSFVQQKGYWGLFVGKLVPMFRTLVSIPAGVMKMDFTGYTVFSLMGITVWNLFFVGAGYYFGELVLPMLSK